MANQNDLLTSMLVIEPCQHLFSNALARLFYVFTTKRRGNILH